MRGLQTDYTELYHAQTASPASTRQGGNPATARGEVTVVAYGETRSGTSCDTSESRQDGKRLGRCHLDCEA